MKMKKTVPFLCGAFALLLAGSCLQPVQVRADMKNYNYVSIASGVVDSITVNGVTVDAMYRPYDSGVDTDTTTAAQHLSNGFTVRCTEGMYQV